MKAEKNTMDGLSQEELLLLDAIDKALQSDTLETESTDLEDPILSLLQNGERLFL